MAKCKYILTLPGGGTIELPASFGKLEISEELNSLYKEYLSVTDETKKEEKLHKLAEEIKGKVPKQIHGNTIKSIITRSENIEQVYESINKIIVELGNYESIESAIKNYIFEGKKGSANKTLNELRSKLSKPRTAKYFKDLGLTGVLGATNLIQERYRMYSKNEENKEFGFPTDISKNLVTVLKAVIDNNQDKKFNNLLYGIEGSFIGKAWSSEDVVIYELGNDLSLFEGLFKREAKKVDPLKLIPIIDEINKLAKTKKEGKVDLTDFNVEEFFAGKVENGNIQESQFNILLDKVNDLKIAKYIDQILNLVADTINPDSKTLSKALKSLFYQASASYAKNNLFKKGEDIKFVTKEIELEKEYKKKTLSFTEMDSTVRDQYFSKEESIDDDLYETAIKTIKLNKDLIKFPVGEYGMYALVTNIFKRGDNIAVYGIYKNQYGELETLDTIFKKGDSVIYRKREEAIDPFQSSDIITENKGMLIVSETPLNQKLVKKLVRRGDLVNGNLVLGVHPASLYLEKPDKSRYNLYYNNIKRVVSAIALRESEIEKDINPNQFVQVNDGYDLSEGDYFLFTEGEKQFYKRILFADKENVYSLISGRKTAIIKATKREGLIGLRNAEGEMTSQDIETVKAEMSRIGRSSATMSSFTNPSKAREGDFFVYRENNAIKYGKILNNDKVLLLDSLSNRLITDLDKLPEVTFFTKRDISNSYYLFTIRANNYEISFAKDPKPLEVEVRYVIPKGTNIDKLVMTTEGYANIGSYKELGFIEDSDIDITDRILHMYEQDPGTKVFIKKTSSESNKFKRNLTSLTEIKYFNDLSPEIKKELNILSSGTYFSLYRKEDIDRNIYRIVSVSDGIVIANLNKFSSTGEIITTEVELKEEDLLASREGDLSPVGSIARLYIQNGNTKMGAVFKEVNKLSEQDDSTRKSTNKAINKLINKLQNYIKGLDVKVELVPAEENFEHGQKAKIITTVEGKTEILINNEIGQTEDVIHEFLHLFLTPLRYKYPEIYYTLIQSVVKNPDLNVTEAEEQFVKFVAGKMELEIDFLDNFEDLQAFVTGLQTILVDVDAKFVISKEDNPLTLLSTPLMDLFNIDRKDNTNPMYNLGMVTTEPMMRE